MIKHHAHSVNTGFSLVEVMLSAAILGFAIVIASSQYFQQVKIETSANVENQARSLLSQIATRVSTNAAAYPQIVDASGAGKPITYIECYTLKGIPRNNKNGVSTPAGTFLVDPTKTTDYCLSSQLASQTGTSTGSTPQFIEPGFEIHVTANPSVSDQAYIDLMILSDPNDRNVAALKTSLRTTIQFEPRL